MTSSRHSRAGGNPGSIITDHIDLWTSSIRAKNTQGRGNSKKRELYGIKKLRELILELAVRGKLVPQDVSDEPAGELLKHIAVEKAQLITETKTKVKKSFLEITEDETPFVLPEGWGWVRLDSICNINGGFAFRSSQYDEEGVRVIRISDFDEKGFKDEKIVRHQYSDLLEPYVLEVDNILMAMTGGTVGKSLLVSSLHEKMVVNQRVATIKISSRISSRFISCALQISTVQRVIHKAKNSTNDNISMSDIKGFFIPMPPVAEQHRIVAKVDELMTLCDQLEQQTEASLDAHNLLVDTLLTTLTEARDAKELSDNWARLADHFDTLITTDYAVEQLKQTILQLAVQGKLVPQDPNDEPASELLKRIAAEKEQLIKNKKIKKQKPLPEITDEEKPFELPPSWEWERLGNISHLITDGAHHTPTYISSGIPFLSVKDMSSGVLNFSNTKFISKNQHEELSKRCSPKKGDLLLTKIGTTGVPIIIDTDIEFSIFVSVALIKFPVGKLSGNFLSQLIKSPVVKQQSEEGTQGVGNKNLVLKTIAAFKMVIPPLDQQHRIVAKVNELMIICDQLQTRLNDAQTTQLHLADTTVNEALN